MATIATDFGTHVTLKTCPTCRKNSCHRRRVVIRYTNAADLADYNIEPRQSRFDYAKLHWNIPLLSLLTQPTSALYAVRITVACDLCGCTREEKYTRYFNRFRLWTFYIGDKFQYMGFYP